MNKTALSATQIRDEVKKHLLLLPAFVGDPSALTVPLPRRHPLDAQSRNWDMDEIDSSSYKRRVIEEAREAFFFSDEEEADELISDAFTKS
jgi:hypothetical protein